MGWIISFALIVCWPSFALASAALDQDIASSLSRSLEGGHWHLALAASFVGGFLTALTPCVYPLIPITVRYFGGMQRGRSRVVRLALIYIAGMALLYTILGTVFASLNLVFGSFLASPWMLTGIAVFSLAMGASMLGAFTVQLPSGLSTRLATVGGDSAAGAFGMGLVSGLVAAPCTGPVLAVILTVIASSGDLFTGAVFMVAFSAGLGVPFLGLALASGQLQRLPKSGRWMELVKGLLATAMFVVAIYFAELAYPAVGSWFAWGDLRWVAVGAVAIFSAGLGYFALRLEGSTSGHVFKGLATLALTVAITAGVLGQDVKPAVAREGGITWVRDHDTGFERAKAEGKPVMIDFTADWCVACKELDSKVFSTGPVQKEAERFVALKLDATAPDDAMESILERYRVMGLPAVLFFDTEGQLLDNPRVTGFMPPEKFLELMARVR